MSRLARAIAWAFLINAALTSGSHARDGADPAYLLLHGWTGDRTGWAPVADELGPRAHAVDLPGHGADATDVTGWTLERFASALELRRRHLGESCLVLVAHSNGAYIARQYWRMFPARVAAIVIVEGTFLNPFASRDQFRFAREAIENGWLGYQENPSGLEGASPRTTKVVRAMIRRASKPTALATLDMLTDEAAWGYDTIGVPVTFAIADTPFWTPGHRRDLSLIAPDHRFVELGPVSHYAQLDAPEQVAAIAEDARRTSSCRSDREPSTPP